jgi:hypothetical protein
LLLWKLPELPVRRVSNRASLQFLGTIIVYHIFSKCQYFFLKKNKKNVFIFYV